MKTFVLDTSVLLSDPGAMGRFAEHDVVLPLVVISELEGKRDHPELGWFARQALRVLDDLRIEHGRLDLPIPVGRGDAAGRAQPQLDRRRCRPASGSTTTTAGSWPSRSTSRPRARRRAGQQGPAAAGQGGVDRPAGAGVPRRAGRLLRLDRHGRADGRGRRARRAVRARPARPASRPRELPTPHRAGAAVRQRGSGLGPGDSGQVGAAGPRRPRRLRRARPLGRAAGRDRPAARPRHRHRVARRPGRHRQVGAGAVRRAGVGAGAPGAQEGRRLPAAVRRRRPGARLPAR